MNKLIKFLGVGVFAFTLTSVQSCGDDDDYVNVKPVTPNETVTNGLEAEALNLFNTSDGRTAQFSELINVPRIISYSENNINIGSQNVHKLGYAFAFVIDSNQMLGMPGDEIEITFNSSNQYDKATFTLPNGQFFLTSIDNPTISFTIPDEMGENFIVKGQSEYVNDENQKFIRKGEIQILNEYIMIAKNIKYKDIIVGVGDKIEIPYNWDRKWVSSNPEIAKVEDSVIMALSTGEVTLSSGDVSFTVKVDEDIDLFMEPCTDWGAEINHVKSYMSGYEIESENEEDGNIKLSYALKDVTSYTYNFDNGGLSAAMVLYGNTDTEAVQNFINYHYIDTGIEQDGIHLYLTQDGKTAVGISKLYGIIYEFIYIPSGSRAQFTQIVKKIALGNHS